MSIDIKVQYNSSTRRFALPLVPVPSFRVLVERALQRHGLPYSKGWALSYVDDDEDSITFSSDSEVVELWPAPTMSAYVDTLPPFKFSLVPPAQGPENESDDASAAPDTRAETDAQQEDSLDENDPPTPELHCDNDDDRPFTDYPFPAIAITRSVMDIVEQSFQRLPIDDSVRDAGVGLVNTVALQVEQFLGVACAAGKDFMAAVNEERTRRMEAEASARFSSAEEPRL